MKLTSKKGLTVITVPAYFSDAQAGYKRMLVRLQRLDMKNASMSNSASLALRTRLKRLTDHRKSPRIYDPGVAVHSISGAN